MPAIAPIEDLRAAQEGFTLCPTCPPKQVGVGGCSLLYAFLLVVASGKHTGEIER